MAQISKDAPALAFVEVPMTVGDLVARNEPVDHEWSGLRRQVLPQLAEQRASGSIESQKHLAAGMLAHGGQQALELPLIDYVRLLDMHILASLQTCYGEFCVRRVIGGYKDGLEEWIGKHVLPVGYCGRPTVMAAQRQRATRITIIGRPQEASTVLGQIEGDIRKRIVTASDDTDTSLRRLRRPTSWVGPAWPNEGLGRLHVILAADLRQSARQAKKRYIAHRLSRQKERVLLGVVDAHFNRFISVAMFKPFL